MTNDNIRQRPASFDALLLQHEPLLRRLSAWEPDREDAYQQLFCAALESWEQFREDGNFGGWLIGLSRYALRRERSVHARHHLLNGSPELVIAMYRYNNVNAWPGQETRAIVASELSAIPAQECSVLTRIAVGETLTESASTLGISRSECYRRLVSARASIAANDNAPAREAA